MGSFDSLRYRNYRLLWTGAILSNVGTWRQCVAFAFNGPTWQAFVPSLVPPEAMVNAIALNSAQFSLARVIGPAIAGAIIAVSGSGAAIVFSVNAVSFLTVIGALALIRTEPSGSAERRPV